RARHGSAWRPRGAARLPGAKPEQIVSLSPRLLRGTTPWEPQRTTAKLGAPFGERQASSEPHVLTGASLLGGRGHSAPHGVSSPLRPGMFQRRAWYHAHARTPRWSVNESRGRIDRRLQAASGGRSARRRRATGMGAGLRPRPETGAPARIPEGPRPALARQGALLRRRAPW